MSGLYKQLKQIQQSKQIECNEARNMIKNQGGLLLDVRSYKEFCNGSIPGAVNMPLQSLEERHGFLNKKRPIVVCSVSGARSAKAQSALKDLGYDNVHNLGSIRKYLTCQ